MGKHIYIQTRFICLFERSITTARISYTEKILLTRDSREKEFLSFIVAPIFPEIHTRYTPSTDTSAVLFKFSGDCKIIAIVHFFLRQNAHARGSLRAKLEFCFDAGISEIFINATLRGIVRAHSFAFLFIFPFLKNILGLLLIF